MRIVTLQSASLGVQSAALGVAGTIIPSSSLMTTTTHALSPVQYCKGRPLRGTLAATTFSSTNGSPTGWAPPRSAVEHTRATSSAAGITLDAGHFAASEWRTRFATRADDHATTCRRAFAIHSRCALTNHRNVIWNVFNVLFGRHSAIWSFGPTRTQTSSHTPTGDGRLDYPTCFSP